MPNRVRENVDLWLKEASSKEIFAVKVFNERRANLLEFSVLARSWFVATERSTVPAIGLSHQSRIRITESRTTLIGRPASTPIVGQRSGYISAEPYPLADDHRVIEIERKV